jgi:hypothetical protein
MGNSTAKWDDLSDPKSVVVLHPSVTKFDNLEAKVVEKIWSNFATNSFSFAVSPQELLFHLGSLRDIVPEYESEVLKLFAHFHSLQNDEAKKASKIAEEQGETYGECIDFMEIIAGLLFTCKMTTEEKLDFLFDLIDFDRDEGINKVKWTYIR